MSVLQIENSNLTMTKTLFIAQLRKLSRTDKHLFALTFLHDLKVLVPATANFLKSYHFTRFPSSPIAVTSTTLLTRQSTPILQLLCCSSSPPLIAPNLSFLPPLSSNLFSLFFLGHIGCQLGCDMARSWFR